MIMRNKPNFMTVDEVAEYLRMKKVTIYKHAQEGKIPAFKFGSTWRFKKSRIDKWIDSKETGSVSAPSIKKEHDYA